MRLIELPIAGLRVGHAVDPVLRSGVTVIIPEQAAVASIAVVGGSPGTRESDLLAPEQAVQHIDGIALSGGSAFGLDAATGLQSWLRDHGRGYPVVGLRIPIVPAAILFDLNNGGDKHWGRYSPYRDLGYAAAEAAGYTCATGRAGAGYGATTASGPGGLGFAAERLACGATVMAIMAVNAAGSAHVGDGPHFWAAPFEQNGEFGGRGLPNPLPSDLARPRVKPGHSTAGLNTTIGVVVTDAVLTKVEARNVAVMAHDGFARALYPVHTPGDGDLLFVISTGAQPFDRHQLSLLSIGTSAANVVARAIAQGVYEAERAVP
jgi:L-aminopeptidase/D-esterase-like protein